MRTLYFVLFVVIAIWITIITLMAYSVCRNLLEKRRQRNDQTKETVEGLTAEEQEMDAPQELNTQTKSILRKRIPKDCFRVLYDNYGRAAILSLGRHLGEAFTSYGYNYFLQRTKYEKVGVREMVTICLCKTRRADTSLIYLGTKNRPAYRLNCRSLVEEWEKQRHEKIKSHQLLQLVRSTRLDNGDIELVLRIMPQGGEEAGEKQETTDVLPEGYVRCCILGQKNSRLIFSQNDATQLNKGGYYFWRLSSRRFLGQRQAYIELSKKQDVGYKEAHAVSIQSKAGDILVYEITKTDPVARIGSVLGKSIKNGQLIEIADFRVVDDDNMEVILNL